ncbi:hypothetical protein ElyMa_002112400 [Elysia marginata]|uniref:Uncharacterized protein n=1 Tax=Elysia marginata TaxID=1093978 RepID=A0AAV4FIX7_9GAST|nr:hypothetical protein ElyMa_002112400 [Elysia marginata]
MKTVAAHKDKAVVTRPAARSGAVAFFQNPNYILSKAVAADCDLIEHLLGYRTVLHSRNSNDDDNDDDDNDGDDNDNDGNDDNDDDDDDNDVGYSDNNVHDDGGDDDDDGDYDDNNQNHPHAGNKSPRFVDIVNSKSTL